MHWPCSRTKDEGERGTIAERGERDCVPRLGRDTTLSIQCPVDPINDWELIEIGMLPGQIDCPCSGERVEESPSAQWLMSSLRKRRVWLAIGRQW